MKNALVGYIIFVVAVLLLFIMFPALSKSRAVAKRVICENNIKGISNAVRIYKHDTGEYPQQEKWCDLILNHPGGFSEKAFWCRIESKVSVSYSMNKSVYAAEPNDVSPQLILLFESDLGRNAVGGRKDLVLRHEKEGLLGCNISFVDGHVEFVTEDKIDGLKWSMEEKSNGENKSF